MEFSIVFYQRWRSVIFGKDDTEPKHQPKKIKGLLNIGLWFCRIKG